MKTLFISLMLFGCSASDSNLADAGSESNVGSNVSMCWLPSKNIGVVCFLNETPTSQSWGWVSTSVSGEQIEYCNAKLCPVGYMCIVQSDVSGMSDGEMLFGTCK